MDDISRKLGISKKTLYQHVKDKEDLLSGAVEMFNEYEEKQLSDLHAKGLNAIEENLEIKKWAVTMLKNLHPSVTYDMKKFHPAIFHSLIERRQQFMYKSAFDNLIKGQKEGVYRTDLNADVIAKLFIGKMEVMFDEVLFPSDTYSSSDVYMEWFVYHIHGIATPKGIELLNESIKNIK